MKSKIVIRVIVLLMIVLCCTACGNSATATSMHLTKTEGTVNVEDGEGENMSPEENMGLYSGYHMETRKESYAWINLDSVKMAKMDSDSEIEIQKDGKLLEILVSSGSLYFNITEPLAEDETLNIRTSTMAVGIRGTCGWVSVTDEEYMEVYILEGTVECSLVNESGKSMTVLVSSGEKAQIGTSENGTDEIEVKKFNESDIQPFAMEELEKDEELCNEILEAAGLDVQLFLETGITSVPEDDVTDLQDEEETQEDTNVINNSENAEAAKILQEYLDTELVPGYGYADLSAKERTFGWDASYNENQNWTGVYGIAKAEIFDLDGDGREELLVIILEEQNINLSIYEAENNVTMKAAEILEERNTDMDGFDVVFSVVNGRGINYLFFRDEVNGIILDGSMETVKLYCYDGTKLYTPLAILQTAGGTADFEYTAYKRDENDILLSEELILQDYDYAHYYKRIEELFGEYGMILDSTAVSNEKGIFDNLPTSDGYKELLHLEMSGDYQGEGVVYRFTG